MSFYYPLGLLGLIGIPIVIFIYIIKSKYTEQTVSSTYLWELSERFLKRRKPISKLTGIITLLLQLLAVLIVSVAIAHPVFTVRASANDIFFILDGSASMNMTQGENTRFEIAKERINKIIDDSHGGSTYSLILAGDTTETVFEGVSDKEQAKIFVGNLAAGWTASDCASAATAAQEYYDINRSAIMYLITDKTYDVNDALTLIDVSKGENNCAFYSYGCFAADGGTCAEGQVISYLSDADIKIEMQIKENAESELITVDEVTVSAKAGEPTDFMLKCAYSQYAELRLVIVNNDAMAQDNTVILYDAVKGQARTVLIISDTSDKNDDAAYLKSAIVNAGKAQADVITPEEYEARGAQGYGMYVFNGYAPQAVPDNAPVWLIDAINGSDKTTGIGFRDYAVPRDATGPYSYYSPEYNEPSTAAERQLMLDLVGRDIAVRTYAQYNVPRNFSALMSVDGDSLICAGLNGYNNREVVFAFRVKDSNLGLWDDFLILVRNLMDYTFPSVLTQTDYVCGDTASVNIVSGCEGIVLTSPSGNSNTLDTLDADVCEVPLTEAGTYTFTVKMRDNSEQNLYVYAAVPESESGISEGGSIHLRGEREFEYSDGFYDNLLLFFIAIALLVMADWGVYCYEQYQLR